MIKKYGFNELGDYYHSFEPGITGAVVLAESHIAFHTWPEFGYVSLNVFTCNYTKDNDENAKSAKTIFFILYIYFYYLNLKSNKCLIK